LGSSAGRATPARRAPPRPQGRGGRSPTTLLRHAAAGQPLTTTLPVPRLTCGVEPPPARSGLVARVGGSLVLPSRVLRADPTAVPLTTVAAGADHDVTAATVTDEQPLALDLPMSFSRGHRQDSTREGVLPDDDTARARDDDAALRGVGCALQTASIPRFLTTTYTHSEWLLRSEEAPWWAAASTVTSRPLFAARAASSAMPVASPARMRLCPS